MTTYFKLSVRHYLSLYFKHYHTESFEINFNLQSFNSVTSELASTATLLYPVIQYIISGTAARSGVDL